MRSSRVAALCAVAALLLLAVVVARGASAVPSEVADPPFGRWSGDRATPQCAERENREESSCQREAPRRQRREDTSLVQTVVFVLVGALLLVPVLALVGLLRSRRRRERLGLGVEDWEPLDLPGAAPVQRMRRAVERARAELAHRAGGSPGDAVVAAWLRLEAAAGRRPPHQTATEFTAALLARHTADEAALDQLRELYQRARFGPAGQVGDADAAAAVAALDRILDTLAESAEPVR